MEIEVIEESFIFHSVKRAIVKDSRLEGEGRIQARVMVNGKEYKINCVVAVLLTRERSVEEILGEV